MQPQYTFIFKGSFDKKFALLAIELPMGGRIGAFENMQFDLTSDKYAKTRVHQTNLPLLKLSKLKIPSKPVKGIYFSLISFVSYQYVNVYIYIQKEILKE